MRTFWSNRSGWGRGDDGSGDGGRGDCGRIDGGWGDGEMGYGGREGIIELINLDVLDNLLFKFLKNLTSALNTCIK